MSTSPPATRARRRRGPITLAVTLALLAAVAIPTAAQAAPKDFFGLIAVKPSNADYNRMKSLGAGTYRVEIPWPSTQPNRNGPFRFGAIDARMRAVAAAGLKPLPILFGTPPYISGNSDHVYGIKRSWQRREWGQFVSAMMRRYKPGGAFWRENPQLSRRLALNKMLFWNEQNARDFWWPKVSPGQFSKLLKTTDKALNRVAPKVKIILGGMYGYPSSKSSMNAKKFLSKVYRKRGAKRRIDGVAVHPYAGGIKGMKKQIKNARKVMNKARDRRAEIVIAEFGWSSHGNRNSKIVKGKQGQKRLLKKAYKKVLLKKRRRWKIRHAFWYAYNDTKSDSFCLWCAGAGLVDRRNKLKPSGRAWRAIVRKAT